MHHVVHSATHSYFNSAVVHGARFTLRLLPRCLAACRNLRRLVTLAEEEGINEFDIYRMDRCPPAGTISALPPWFIK